MKVSLYTTHPKLIDGKRSVTYNLKFQPRFDGVTVKVKCGLGRHPDIYKTLTKLEELDNRRFDQLQSLRHNLRIKCLKRLVYYDRLLKQIKEASDGE